MNDEATEKVVTQLGAATLAGVTAEAVRVAVQQGRVEVAAELTFGTHPVRLLELASVARYWQIPPDTVLREDVVLEDIDGDRWLIVTPESDAAVFRRRPVVAGPLWFRGSER